VRQTNEEEEADVKQMMWTRPTLGYFPGAVHSGSLTKLRTAKRLAASSSAVQAGIMWDRRLGRVSVLPVRVGLEAATGSCTVTKHRSGRAGSLSFSV